jgi:integrase/recombinase XerD
MGGAVSFKIGFYIRRKKNPREYSVYCCLKMPQSSPTELVVWHGIKRNEWDLRKGRPRQTCDRLIKLSIFLDSVKAKLYEIYLDLMLTREEVSVDKIKNIYIGKNPNDYTVIGVIDEAIEKYKDELAPGSLKNYYTTKAYVVKFCKEKYKEGDLRLKHLTYSFIDQLKSFILHTPIKAHDRCTTNGCMKHLERVKKIITWAYKMRYIDRDIFSAYRIRKVPSKEGCRLTWKQLKDLEKRIFATDLLNLVNDIFIFCCYTGMAPIDAQRLQPHQIIIGLDGQRWVNYNRAKSKVCAYVPLLTPATAILEKHQQNMRGQNRSTIFPLVSNQVLNRNIKIIGEICELGFMLNFYVSRYTFATTVTLFQGVAITSIKHMMGHRKIESTLHYAIPDKSVIDADMNKVQQTCDQL